MHDSSNSDRLGMNEQTHYFHEVLSVSQIHCDNPSNSDRLDFSSPKSVEHCRNQPPHHKHSFNYLTSTLGFLGHKS
jgi:hypothetical protein